MRFARRFTFLLSDAFGNPGKSLNFLENHEISVFPGNYVKYLARILGDADQMYKMYFHPEGE